MNYSQFGKEEGLSLDNPIPMKPLIDAIKIGILFFDEGCRVVLSNQSAISILQSRDWLWFSDKRLKTTCRQGDDIEKQVLHVIQDPQREPLKPLLLKGKEEDMLLLDFSALNSHDDNTLAVCLIVDPQKACSVDAQVLREVYGLTETEAKIAAMIADGLDYKAIASGRNVSIETIRTYTKSIFKKVGVNSRAGLVYQVHSSLAPLSVLL